MQYAIGDKVEYQYGGYVLIGTVTECESHGYMVSGLKRRPIFIHQHCILGKFG